MNDLTNWTPPPFPQRKVLEGRYCRLEPLDVARHGAEIAAAVLGADDVWDLSAGAVRRRIAPNTTRCSTPW